MRTSLVAAVCVAVVGVLWRGAIEESGPGWLRVTAIAMIVVGVVSVVVTLSVYAMAQPVQPRTLGALLVVAGVIGMLIPWA